MALFYLDTSAIVKRYSGERGTQVVDSLLGYALPAERFYTSFLSVLELTSAMLRLAKGGHVTEMAATQMLSRFRLDLQDRFRIWPVDDDVMRGAMNVVEQYRLRSPDAIHLATAITIFSVASGQTGVMVSSDRELLAAAEASRISWLSPEDTGAFERLAELRTSQR